MHFQVIRAHRAAILIVCAAIAAACNSSPVDVDSNPTAAVPEVLNESQSAESGTLPVSPLQVDFGNTTTKASVRLTNTGTTSLNWTASEGVDWLELNERSGTIGARSSETVNLRVDRSGRSDGTYSTAIDFSAGTHGSARVPVTMAVGSPFPVSPLEVDFGGTATKASVTLTNGETSSLNWTASEGVDWLELNERSGTVGANTSETVDFKVDRTGKSPGSYSTYVNFSSADLGSARVQVSMTVGSSFAITPLEVDFGSTATGRAVTLTNSGSTSLPWTASEQVGWLGLGSTSGTIAANSNKTLNVNVNRAGLTAGSYATNITFSAGAAGSAQIPVSMTVPSTSDTTPPPPPPSGSTVNVRDFGAKGNGLADDSPAFEKAIDALPASGGSVLVPAGTYLLEPRFLSPVRPLSLIEKTNVSIVGQGKDSTILKMVNGSYPGSTFMILILNSSGIQIRDLTFDMNRDGSWYGDEQSHIVRVESSQDVYFSNVRFTNSPGDGIKFIGLGELGSAWVDRARIENSVFFNMWRNGITIQRGVRNLQIRGNTFERVSQQSISSEPTGFDGAATDVLIENNVIRHFSGSYSIALSGGGSRDPMKRLTFRNNTVDNGAVFFLWVDGIQIEGNTLRGGPKKSALRLQDISEGLVANNSITGSADGASVVVQLLNDATALSHHVTIRDNRIDARAGGTGLQVKDGGGQITVAGNEVLGAGNARGIAFETLVIGAGLRSGFEVMNNDVQDFRDAIAFIARGDRFADVTVASTTADHDQQPSMETIGILFDRTGSPGNFADLEGNSFGAGIKTPVRVLQGG